MSVVVVLKRHENAKWIDLSLLLFIKCQRNEEAEKLQPFLLYVNLGVTSKAIRYNI